MKLFDFDTARYAADFAAQGYVHIPQALTEEFFAVLLRQVEEHAGREWMADFALKDKQQALYEFPQDSDCLDQLFAAVGAICGLDSQKMVLSERHIKAYGADAEPDPLAHKDRFASEISVGFSVKVPPGAPLVLYPDDDVSVNPYNSAAELRAGLRPERLPEKTLQGARRVEINDAPRDVVMFRGNALWHLRAQAANTTMLYLKLNTFNCDPLGEDPSATATEERTCRLTALPDEKLMTTIPLLGRRVDHLQRRYNHRWQEVCGAVFRGGRSVPLDEDEFRALRAMDGQHTVGQVSESLECSSGGMSACDKIRRLAACGVIDLLPS